MKQSKYILSLLLALAFSFIADAQVYQSKSYVKKTTVTKEETPNPWKKCQWYGKIGVSIPTSSDDYYDVAGLVGADLDFGFKLRMGRHGWYWGMDLSLFTGGHKFTDIDDVVEFPTSKTIFGAHLGLTNFGWRARFNDVILDLHAGLAVEVNTSGKIYDEYDDECILKSNTGNFCFPFGVGVSYKKILFDLTYKPYVTPRLSIRDGYDEFTYDNLLISVGYLF